MAIDPRFKAYLFEAKKQYPNIFTTVIKGERFIFRPLTKYEFEEIVLKNDLARDELNESVCEICTIYPDDYNFEETIFAGVPYKLSQQIIKISGFGNENLMKEEIDKQREAQDKIDNYMQNVICTAFSGIEPYDIRNWDFYKITEYFARAEWILHNLKPSQAQPQQEGQGGQSPQQNPQQQQQQPQTPAGQEVVKQQSFASNKHAQNNPQQAQANSQQVQKKMKNIQRKQGMGANVVNQNR